MHVNLFIVRVNISLFNCLGLIDALLPWRINLNLPRPHYPVIARSNQHLFLAATLGSGIVSPTPGNVVDLVGAVSAGVGREQSP